MGHDLYLYVQMDERVWRVNVNKLGDKSKPRPEFELIYDNSNGELPIGMGCISVNSKLYMVGGQKEQKITEDDDDDSSSEGDVLNLKSFVLNLDAIRICKDLPSMHGQKFNPLVVSVNHKFYVLARRPFYDYDKALEQPVFEVFDPAAVNGGSWKELPRPPWTDPAQFKFGGDYIYHHFVWGHKIVFCTWAGLYIFYTDMKKWDFTDEKLSPFPILSCASAEFDGFLIAMPWDGEQLVAYRLDSIAKPCRVLDELWPVFNPPFAQSKFQGFLTHLGDGDGGRRMCLLYAGMDYYWRWCARIANFRVSISCNAAGDRLPFAYLETLQHYDFEKFDNPARWIDSAFVMGDYLNNHDVEANARFMDAYPAGSDEYYYLNKHEAVADASCRDAYLSRSDGRVNLNKLNVEVDRSFMRARLYGLYRDIMGSQRSAQVSIQFNVVLKEILEKLNLKPAIHSIENIRGNHKPAFIASVEIKDGDKKTKFCGMKNSTKKEAEKELAMMVMKHLNDQSELANVKAKHGKLREDYEKLLAENEKLKKQPNDAIKSEKSTYMHSEDLNSKGKICVVHNTNSYEAIMNCDMSTICHVLPNNDDVHYWNEVGSTNKSSYLLRILGMAHVGDDQIILFSEPVDQDFEGWAQHNFLINFDNDLTPSFTALLLDMLKAMNYFHSELKQAHGEICGKNIYVINGRAKFANVMHNNFTKCYDDDINDFCKMVKSSFNAKNILLPLELEDLLLSLKKPNGLCNSVNHPILLNSYDRDMYRQIAYKKTYDLNFNKDMITAYENRKLNFSWTEKVKFDAKESFLSVLYYDPEQQDEQSQQIKYNDSPKEFLRFSRNSLQHIRDETEEEIDKYLNSIDPHFLGILHEILTSKAIFINLE